MKELKVIFTDEQFKKLRKAKDLSSCQNWRNFIMKLSKGVSVRREFKKLRKAKDLSSCQNWRNFGINGPPSGVAKQLVNRNIKRLNITEEKLK